MTDVLRYAAFSTDPAGGNPAGVVLDATGLADEAMQRIAAEVGYSETAFVVPDGGEPRRYRIRYFSPLAEVPFCGHATIATAVALAERTGAGALLLDSNVGEIAVETVVDEQGVVARMTTVPTSSEPAADDDVRRALAALRWPASDLGDLPPHVAFAGAHHLVLHAATRERLRDLSYDFDALKALMTERGWTTVQLVHPQSATVFHCRDPFPVGGVVEDPATGAAAAALGGYLRALGRITVPTTLTIHQGDDLGRPSLITVDVDPDDPQVVVSGRAVAIPEAPDPLGAIAWPVRTDRLTLRRATRDDLEAVWRLRRDPDVARWISGVPGSMDDWRDFWEEPGRIEATIMVELDGEVIGDLMLRVEDAWSQLDVEDEARGVQGLIGWELHPVHGGQGYGTESVRELLRLAFDGLGLRRVVAQCFADNTPSWRLMERVGMRRESHTARSSLHRDGTWHDDFAYGLLADEWRAAQGRPTT